MRRSAATLVALGLLVVPTACSGSPTTSSRATDLPDTLAATWRTTDDGVIAGELTVPSSEAKGTVIAEISGGTFDQIPAACRPSSLLSVTSRLSYAEDRLQCLLDADDSPRSLTFTAHANRAGGDLTGTVRWLASDETVSLPTVTGTAADVLPEPALRFLSSPDFLNADVGDLAAGDSDWDPDAPGASANSTNPAYRAALASVMQDWKSLDPAGVLVAGDLVDGRWGTDRYDTGNFGPTRTLEERKEAVRRAAATYYPAWRKRFTDAGLSAFPAMGDHEYGDNDWPTPKRELVPTFKDAFARYFTKTPDGQPLYADHPEGPAKFSAYAGRPSPDVQIITLDVFDITADDARIGLDRQQFTWLRQVLRRAQIDGVKWIVVQGHTPILWPVRHRGSSSLHVPQGEDSQLWQLFERFGVDLYLSGEVHDVTLREAGGVTQITHGGLFQFGLTNYLVLDFFDDRLDLTLRDFATSHNDPRTGPALWQTGRTIPAELKISAHPFTIGTASLTADGGLTTSGILTPYTRSADPGSEDETELDGD